MLYHSVCIFICTPIRVTPIYYQRFRKWNNSNIDTLNAWISSHLKARSEHDGRHKDEQIYRLKQEAIDH